ncbi:sec1 family domain-containing protein MIP3 isoform X2 [Impatiens glandulifera]|uniref:sec1 family domain-containing protein MIP3 isoform X2 n=1 Tax=Impatiens glandulifera TaxID=253017 RepID=UPI001FB10463|nr:sec1 family domain-containing protein MIP3 isoform X2 [Impatiens glandulifera]
MHTDMSCAAWEDIKMLANALYSLPSLSKLQTAHSAYPDSPLGPDAFHEYETLLIQDYEEFVGRSEFKTTQSGDRKSKANMSEDEGWSQLSDEDISSPSGASSHGKKLYHDPADYSENIKRKLIVFVHHFPLVLCPLSPRVFVLPSEGLLSEASLSNRNENSLSPGLPAISNGLPHDGEDIPPGATQTAHFLYYLAAKMDLKLEIYSLGDFSKTVGKLITDMSSLYDVGRRKRSAGLLIIDRTLDLLTPCSHGDSLVDRVFTALPRRDRTDNASVKGSQSQLKSGPVNVQRAPLDVQIPLTKFLSEADSVSKNHRLIENIESFLYGWNANGLDSPSEQLLNLNARLSVEKPVHTETEILNGAFVSNEGFRGTPYLEALLDRGTKDGLMLVRKWLQETLRQENINLNIRIRPGTATKSDLQSMVKALARTQDSWMRNKGIIHLTAAALHALDELFCTKWDAFNSAERTLNASAGGDTSQNLAAQISDLVNKSVALSGSSQRLLSLKDALLLTVSGYILAGQNFPTSGSGSPFSWQEEHFLKEAVVDAILENPGELKMKLLDSITKDLIENLSKKEESKSQLKNDDVDDDQWESWGDDDADQSENEDQSYGNMQLKLELRDRVDNLFKVFHKLSKLKKWNFLAKEGALDLDGSFNNDPYSSKGLLYRLLIRILGKQDVPGLEYHSSTVGRLFKSGFGRFGLVQAKPSLADQNIILVFFIGGINGVEAREAQEALAASGRPDIELILGGTTLLNPNDMYDLLLGDSSYL